MSTAASRPRAAQGRRYAKQYAKKLLQQHLPVAGGTRPLFRALYHVHVVLRGGIGWSLRFFWYEPLFRSQCCDVGDRFVMEQLPYLVGRGEILIGSDVHFSGKPSIAFSARHCPLPRLSIADGCFLGHNCAITVAREVKIGKHCLIAGGVRISDFDGHPTDAGLRRAGTATPVESVRPVTIGDDVWIGHGALILKGVRIGDRSIVGARAVVTHDVDADTVVTGNPARIVKSLKQL